MRVSLEAVQIPPELSGEDPEYFERTLMRGRLKGLVAIGEEAILQVNAAIHAVSPRPPVDQGLLARRESWQYEIDAEAKSMVVGPIPPVLQRAKVMEAGRRPGQKAPPLNVILAWVHRKGLADRFLSGRMRELTLNRRLEKKVGKSGKKLSVSKKAVAREVEIELAFLIQRSIARKGIAPRRFVETARPKVEAGARELLAAFVREAFNKGAA